MVSSLDNMPASSKPAPLTRERLIQVLNNFADGTYLSISPDVVREAARQLRNSIPTPEAPTIDYTAMNGPEMLAACRDDGAKWAAAFCQHAKKHGHEIDEGWMIGWFANAIENSHDVRTGSAPRVGVYRSPRSLRRRPPRPRPRPTEER